MSHTILITVDFPPIRGGIARLMQLTASCFSSDSITVYAAERADAIQFDSHSPIPVRRYRYRSGTSLLTLVDTLRLAATVLMDIRRKSPSILYIGALWPLGLIGLIGRLFGIHYIVHVYGMEVLRSRGAIIEALRSQILRSASVVVAISGFTRELSISRGVRPDRVVVLKPTIDQSLFRNHESSASIRTSLGINRKYILVTVCRLYPRKGVDRVIEALPAVLDEFPDTGYIVVGDGPDLPRLSALADQLGVSRAIQFVSRCSDVDLVRYYHACDVFAMISRYIEEEADVEGFGIVYLEANACGKPVVAGNSGGVSDAVEDHVTGLLVNPESSDDVGTAIRELFRDPALAARLGQSGLERLDRELSLKSYAEQIHSIVGRAWASARG
ncbi:MAG: glycosyltransferase family 4 protein [Candidatus Hydrogenedentes bacterium]|nr:glycosyltransferase family 4 protein [Candidatus Hydrogenedentota bacterium]